MAELDLNAWAHALVPLTHNAIQESCRLHLMVQRSTRLVLQLPPKRALPGIAGMCRPRRGIPPKRSRRCLRCAFPTLKLTSCDTKLGVG
jgi:hypothetical protein